MANNKTFHPLSERKKREFEEQMAKTWRMAYSFAYSKTGNRDDASDLMQEAYLRAYRSFDTFDEHYQQDRYNANAPLLDKADKTRKFENWFRRILSNLFIDLLRRRPKQRPLSLDQPMSEEEGEESLLMQLRDDNNDPEQKVLSHEMDGRLQNALTQLPEPFRVAVLLCDVEGLSYEEIAAQMRCSIGTVRSRIHRGRTQLRRMLEQEEYSERFGFAHQPAMQS